MHFLKIVATLSSVVSAARLTINIPPSDILPNPSTLPSSTHAILLGPVGVRYDSQLTMNSSLVFDNISPATYLLTIHSHDYIFPPLRVDVQKAEGAGDLISAWQTFRGNEWSNKGPHFGTGADDLSINVRVAARKEFYQARGGFDILSFLKSPMILMGLFSVVMIFGMPYLMENMDPETKAEFEEMQKKSALSGGGAANQLQNFDLAGFLSGKAGNTDQAATAAKKK